MDPPQLSFLVHGGHVGRDGDFAVGRPLFPLFFSAKAEYYRSAAIVICWKATNIFCKA